MKLYSTSLTKTQGARRLPGLLLLSLLILGLVPGCATTEQPENGSRGDGDAARTSAFSSSSEMGPRLASSDSSVRTVQLYQGNDERHLPVLTLGGGGGLTLEFDLLTQQGRPLSIYFYHADRQWERDPVPSRYLDGFRSATLLEYTRARTTGLPYVHYTYRFPSDEVDFRASGNYILRVTEQGEEEEILFERPFFVAEDAGALELRLEELRLGSHSGLSDRPAARYRPPSALGGSPFDFTTCFVPSGQLRRARCVERARLAEQPILGFELPARESFAHSTADFSLDLSRLQPGTEIAGSDLTTVPYEVLLETDYAEFAGAGGTLSLNGQPVVRAAGISTAEPELSAEYASVRFSFVPPQGRPLGGAVVVDGSFHDGPLEEAPRLEWQSATQRYEGDVLLKQGLYEYRYASTDPRLGKALAQNLPMARRRYGAFVYYSDASLGSDRLLMAREAQVD